MNAAPVALPSTEWHSKDSARFLTSRAARARARIAAAWAAFDTCHLCAHHCGVNRNEGQTGRCGAGVRPRIFSAQIEVSDELELIPVFALALAGCDMRCDFCITGANSWNPGAGWETEVTAVVDDAQAALAAGARSIMILGGEPTIHLPTVLEWVAAWPDDAVLIWKTNAHGTQTARTLLDGLFDVWVVDYKFGNDTCARRLAATHDYTRVVQENLQWARGQRQLIVRHLLMPGHVDCCWRPVAVWLAERLPGVNVNLRSGFWPAWKAARHAELQGTVSQSEAQTAIRWARDCQLRLTE